MVTKYQPNFNNTNPFSDTGVKVALATGVAQEWEVPGTDSNIYRAEFSYAANSEVWVALNKTATGIAAGTIEDSYNEEFRPDFRYVKGGDTLSFIANVGTPQVGVRLLSVPN